ncbi:hypothetical protein RUMCAL_03195 [Ruminococcus callidus ATCC 27760]|uniref:Uncharacterized protein n=1 Tax=Ruminococcus callidus ATCC 27760 TaxID=411473 RepID=U2K7P5_9FIRM|nr:hypothetical protein RUMCAL_03195 [Ruminococcus callidus ATCC 27760]
MAIQPYPYVILSLQVLLASYPFDVSCVSAVLCSRVQFPVIG